LHSHPAASAVTFEFPSSPPVTPRKRSSQRNILV
jgi:hypothetical protein